MNKDTRSCIKQISQYTNKNAKSYDVNNILAIEKLIEEFLSIDKAIIYKYNQYKKILEVYHQEEKEIIELEASFIKTVIGLGKSSFNNHVTTDKSFNSPFDNPDGCPIRGMMVVPMVFQYRTIGVLVFFRSLHNGKNFTKKDENSINDIVPILMKLIQGEEFLKEDLLLLLGEEDLEVERENKIKPKIRNVEKIKEKKEARVIHKEDNSKFLEEIKILKEKLSLEKDKKEKLDEKYKKIKILFKEKEKSQEQVLNIQKIKIKNALQREEENKEKIKELEEEILSINLEKEELKALEETIIDNKESQTTLENNIKQLKKENIQFHLLKNKFSRIQSQNTELVNRLELSKKAEEKLDILKVKYSTLEDLNDKVQKEILFVKEELLVKSKRIQELKDFQVKDKIRKSRISNKYKDLDGNVEFLLNIVASNFKNSHHSYSLFELLIYSISSGKGMDILENKLLDTKIMLVLIDLFYHKKYINLKYEKYELVKLFDDLLVYEEKVFENNIQMKINLDEHLPKSLILDSPKIHSLLYHLMNDLNTFTDHNYAMSLDVIYNNKILNLTLSATIDSEYTEENLLKSMFSKSKLSNDKERLDLIVAKKIISILNGNIEIIKEKTYYSYILHIPAKVLDLKFV